MTRPTLLLLLVASLAACSGGERREASTPSAAAPPPTGPAASPSSTPPTAATPTRYELDAPPVAEVGNLCTFRTRQDPIMQGYRDRTGAQWEGEVRVHDAANMDTKWLSPSDRRVATFVAQPNRDTFRMRVDDNCYNAQTKTYHACSKVLEADLSPIRGFARGMDVAPTRALAIQLCEKKVTEVVHEKIGILQDNTDMHCRIVQQTFCEIPPPPPAPARKK